MTDLSDSSPEEGKHEAPTPADPAAPEPAPAESADAAEPAVEGGRSGPGPATGAGSEELQQVHAELAELKDLFKRRLLTDRDGQQKFDALYEQMTFARKGLVEDFVAPIVRELVLVIDRLESMRAHVSAETAEALQGVEVELGEVLARRGVREVRAVGEPFDPRQHEAIERREVDDSSQVGQVVEVRRAGYALDQRVIRPAQVVVGHQRVDGAS